MSTHPRADPTRFVLFVVAVVLIGSIAVFWGGGRGGAPAPVTSMSPDDAAPPSAPAPSSGAPPAARMDPDRTGEWVRPRVGIAVRGLILDRNARPLVGVFVCLDGPGDADRELRSDAAGRFEADGLVAGSYQVVATGPHLLTHSQFARLHESDDLVELTLEIDTGVPVAGQVLDEDLRPVANARITPWRRGPSGEELEARSAVMTDGAGWFELRGAPGAPTFVLVEHPGYPPTKGRLEPTRAGRVVIRRSR